MDKVLFSESLFHISGEEVELHLLDTYDGKDGSLPFYWWNIVRKSDHMPVGKISFRIGHNYHSYYNGNIGYEIDKAYRGHHYALLACQLLPPVAQHHGMDRIYLTCDHDNAASCKTIEKLGAKLIEEVRPPEDYLYYYEGIDRHRIYEWKIPQAGHMTTVYFVRHAQPNFDNHDDASRELSPKGLEDRELVTAFLHDKGIDAVLSSPFRRAVDTVRPFAEGKSMEIVLEDDFRERKIDSVWIEDFHSFSRKQWEDFDYKLSDGECLREVQERNIQALHRVLTRYCGMNIVIGSHGTALSTIINYYDKTFGYSDFEAIRNLMPWIVEFSFDGNECVKIQKHNLFRPNPAGG